MDDSGNILVKRIAKSNVYVKNTTEENSIANDILKVPNGALEQDKPCKLFDMKNISIYYISPFIDIYMLLRVNEIMSS